MLTVTVTGIGATNEGETFSGKFMHMVVRLLVVGKMAQAHIRMRAEGYKCQELRRGESKFSAVARRETRRSMFAIDTYKAKCKAALNIKTKVNTIINVDVRQSM